MICSRCSLTVLLALTVAVLVAPSVQYECAFGLNNDPFSNCDVELHNMNDYIDDVIKDVATKIQEHADNKIEMPHIRGQVSIDTVFVPINCTVQAENGYFTDISTLKRDGVAYLTKNGLKYTLTSSFTVGKAELHYNNYSFTCFGTAITGDVVTEIKGFTLMTQLTVDLTGKKCVAEINYIEIPEFENVKINVTGLGLYNSAISQFLSVISKKWQGETIRGLEQSFKDIANTVLRETCEHSRHEIVEVAREFDPLAKID